MVSSEELTRATEYLTL